MSSRILQDSIIWIVVHFLISSFEVFEKTMKEQINTSTYMFLMFIAEALMFVKQKSKIVTLLEHIVASSWLYLAKQHLMMSYLSRTCFIKIDRVA